MVLRVLVVGATGYIGTVIALEVSKAGIPTSALIRPAIEKADKREINLGKLRNAQIALVESSLDDEEKLVQIIQGFTVVISALSGPDMGPAQLKLIEACKRAGTIKRFIPSEYGGDYRLSGKEGASMNPYLKQYLEAKQAVRDALNSSGLLFTIIINYAFMGHFLPRLGQAGPPPVPDEVSLYADGVKKAFTTLETDVGKVVARTLDDPRTVNKKVVIRVNGTTQREIVAAWEKISGKDIKLNNLSAEELEGIIKGLKERPAIFLGLIKGIWVDGSYEHEVENGILATDIYPDIQFATIEDFLRGLSH